MSKYSPSLSFVSLELGIMAILLAGLLWLEPRIRLRENGFLLVLGQTALFFYLIHRLLLEGVARGFSLRREGGLLETYLAAAAVCILLYPLCIAYRAYKRAHPMSLTSGRTPSVSPGEATGHARISAGRSGPTPCTRW